MKSLVKISGEYFQNLSEHIGHLEQIWESYKPIFMCGGGNLLRGRDYKADRGSIDRIGMMSTVMNGILLKSAISIKSSIFSTIDLDVTQKYSLPEILTLRDAEMIILVGGLGCGYISTDTAAVVRGLELECDLIVKVTKVGGVFDFDPKLNPQAKLISKMNYSEALEKKAFDASSICIAQEHSLCLGATSMEELSNYLYNPGSVGTLIN